MNRNLEDINEVGLLDLLIVVAENIKLLILGSLLVGALAGGYAQLAPSIYVSQAIVAMPAPMEPGQQQVPMAITAQSPSQAAALMVSPVVLDPVIQRLKLDEGRSVDMARKQLVSQVEVVVGEDGLLRLAVSATTPARAQALANAIIDKWIESSTPTQQERAMLEEVLVQADKSLDATRYLVDQLAQENKESLSMPLTRGESGVSIVSLGALQARYLSQALEASRLLRGITRDVVKLAPTLPTSPKPKSIGLFALLGATAAAMALLLWVFIVQAWRSAAKDPRVAPKVLRLRAALGLK